MPANVKVSIPVSVGGYTGQRDAWEVGSNDYEVSATDDNVVTMQSRSSTMRMIRFKLEDLEEALAFIRGTK